MTSISVDELDDAHEQRNDFRRANGSPMVSDPNNDGKFLRYRRPSSYGKPLDDENPLTEWKIWKSMEGVARSPALATQVNAVKDGDRETKKELREKALDRGQANEAADMGTGLHAMTARFEDPKDTDFDPPEQYRDDLDAYWAELQRLGLVSEYVEVQLVNDDFRAAGTADRIYRTTRDLVLPDESVMPAGSLVLGDLKTGAKMDFGLPSYCVQMAIYATGQFYDVVNNVRMPTPEIDLKWMLLMHLPVGQAKCEALWLNINTGLHGAFLTFEVLEWRNKWKSGKELGFDGYRAVSPEIGMPVSSVSSEFEATDGVVNVEVMVEYCRERIANIGKHTEAKAYLIARWPVDLPTPRKGINDPADVVRLLELLDAVERHFSLPFAAADPRPLARKGSAAERRDLSNGRMLLGE